MVLHEVIKAFEKYDGKYKRKEVKWAIKNQKEISPHLIGLIENVLAYPQKYSSNDEYFGHIYAFILLGYFQETKTHNLIIELFSLSDDLITQLFGDIGYSYLPEVLNQTCGGSIKKIQALVLNKKVPVFTRISAASSLKYAVLDRTMLRKDILRFLGSLFTGDETDGPSDFWSLIACEICDLCPNERILEIIKQSYKNNLISDKTIEYEEFEESYQLGIDYALEQIKLKQKLSVLTNIHTEMSTWACFNM